MTSITSKALLFSGWLRLRFWPVPIFWRESVSKKTPKNCRPFAATPPDSDHKVYDFAAAQFDQGLYRLARKEFDLTERPLRIATPDERPIRVPIERYYRDLAGPMVILGEPDGQNHTPL